jgi:PPE-repeat protein
VSALVWWLIPLVACTGALLYVWWSIAAKRRQNTYKSIAEYENFRSAFAEEHPPSRKDKN